MIFGCEAYQFFPLRFPVLFVIVLKDFLYFF